MIIKSKIKGYSLEIKKSFDFFNDLTNKENAFFVIDQNVYNLFGSLFVNVPDSRLFLLDAIEENKTIEMALKICDQLTKLDTKRNTVLVSCGGGITQDLTGFVTSIMYRGIGWIFIPTTLLAACDSCIGGKTSLNYKHFKNLLGTFYPPDRIYICPDFFDTLTEKDYKSGLGEVVKFSIMMGEDGVKLLKQNMDLLLKRDKQVLESFVERSLSFKKTFIEEEEFDLGERVLLNFAHTFGHAFEVSSNYIIPHGTAVALGVLAANSISNARGMLNIYNQENILNLVKKIIPFKLSKDWFKIETIISAIRKDKKQTSENITALLLNDDFRLTICKDISEQEIKKAITYILSIAEVENEEVVYI
ncbi:MAG: 3-dehydroquinate synthase [Eubacteriales bacterium SKADARSKE-1]|nr:3-dehydroquinate synthase [Eubacteriales bacterium SKADARSKE-1]